MKLALAVAGVLTLTLSLAGCGSSSRPSVEPDLAGRPTWGGCATVRGHSVDYVAGVRGSPTVAAAIAPYRKPGDHVVAVPRRAHHPRHWLLVDDAGVIHTSLEASDTGNGWLVDEVETCADR